ncbi:MAG: hypothetical protein C0391_00525 [Anaerolinea sp.]|nr:hypothetical protein [Anaerolinea sp.]
MKEDWKIIKLNEACKVFADGDWIESKDQSNYGIRLIQTGNVGIGVFKDREEKARYISEDTFKRLRCTEIYKDDCLISRLPEPVGRACLIPDLKDRMITAVDCTIVRFEENLVSPDFFRYYSQSDQYLSEVEKETTGTTRKRISRSRLGEIPVPLPSLSEQQRIVAILDEAFAAIDKARENTERNLHNARELFESYLESVFANPGEGWEEKKLGEISVIKGGKRVPKGYKFEKHPTKYPYIRVTDFNDVGSVSLDDIHYINDEVYKKIKNYTITSKDLYISIAGTIGKTGIVPESLNGANLTENACKLIIIPSINNKLVYFFTKTASFINQAGLNTRTTAMPKLALTRLATITVNFPTKYEAQEKLVVSFEKMSFETKKLEVIYQQKLFALDELKKSLLQKAFNGEL